MRSHSVRPIQSLALFSGSWSAVPQSVTFELKEMAAIKRVGFFLHGENNMNPKRMTIFYVFFSSP